MSYKLSDRYLSNSTDPGYVAWGGVQAKLVGYTIPGTACEIDISYCVRILTNGTIQFCLECVQPTAGYESACASTSPADLIRAARDYLASVTYNPPNCGTSYVIAQTYSSTCWQYNNVVINGVTTQIFSPCPAQYCKKTCNVCYDPNTHVTVVSSCTFTTIGTDPGCVTATGAWNPATCYYVYICN